MENSSLSDGAQQADMVSSENAATKFGADQAETNMVKLVDGKLTPFGDTEDDVADDQLSNRYSDDDERAFNGDQNSGLTYENADAGIKADDAGEGIVLENVSNDPAAEAEITGNPDAGDDANTGLPSEDSNRTPTSTFVVHGDMIPATPGTPGPVTPTEPSQPIPPTPPSPGPEIPELPGTPKPETPEIQEPEQPDRSHEIGFRQRNRVYTSGNAVPGMDVPGTQYEGMSAGPDDEQPDTGDSAHPYDVSAKDNDEYQPGERPEEARETRQMPREMMDESSVQAQDMISGNDRSDEKSTDGLDRKYNDPQAARDMAS